MYRKDFKMSIVFQTNMRLKDLDAPDGPNMSNTCGVLKFENTL